MSRLSSPIKHALYHDYPGAIPKGLRLHLGSSQRDIFRLVLSVVLLHYVAVSSGPGFRGRDTAFNALGEAAKQLRTARNLSGAALHMHSSTIALSPSNLSQTYRTTPTACRFPGCSLRWSHKFLSLHSPHRCPSIVICEPLDRIPRYTAAMRTSTNSKNKDGEFVPCSRCNA